MLPDWHGRLAQAIWTGIVSVPAPHYRCRCRGKRGVGKITDCVPRSGHCLPKGNTWKGEKLIPLTHHTWLPLLNAGPLDSERQTSCFTQSVCLPLMLYHRAGTSLQLYWEQNINHKTERWPGIHPVNAVKGILRCPTYRTWWQWKVILCNEEHVLAEEIIWCFTQFWVQLLSGGNRFICWSFFHHLMHYCWQNN